MVQSIIKQLEERNIFKKLYIDEEQIHHQKERYSQLIESHKSTSKHPISIYSSPGRTEVSGNHTDHQQGRVLAAAINLDMIAVVQKRDDQLVMVKSDGFIIDTINLNDLDKKEAEIGTSESLIRGIASRMKQCNYKIGGFEATIHSEVLEGSGLSSSASFEVLIGTILNHEFNEGLISAQEIAQIAQYSENVYFDKPSGLMDQMACSVGDLIMIDFMDKENPKINQLDIDMLSFGYKLCIVDTKGSHADLTPEYASIPNEMKQVANYFNKQYLREVDPQHFFDSIHSLREQCSDRAILRAIHFFNENQRVQDAYESLHDNDFNSFLEIIKASGDSSFKYLQNVYATSEPLHQALSLGIAMSEHILGKHGVTRVHGGGFAGTIQSFVKEDVVKTYQQDIEAIFGKGSCHILSIRHEGGVKVY